MGYEVVRSEAVVRDLELIFDHLFESYTGLGEAPDHAFERAVARLTDIENDLQSLGAPPHQGTLDTALLDKLRHVTKNRAIFYFQVDDETETLRILAVFYGGQDHQRHMLIRLTQTP